MAKSQSVAHLLHGRQASSNTVPLLAHALRRFSCAVVAFAGALAPLVGLAAGRQFALAPIDWGLHAAGPFGPVVHYEDGVLMTVTRRDGQVSMTAITEAGAAIVAELDRNDAMTLAALCTVEGA